MHVLQWNIISHKFIFYHGTEGLILFNKFRFKRKVTIIYGASRRSTHMYGDMPVVVNSKEFDTFKIAFWPTLNIVNKGLWFSKFNFYFRPKTKLAKVFKLFAIEFFEKTGLSIL
jgi:hypothetical protein